MNSYSNLHFPALSINVVFCWRTTNAEGMYVILKSSIICKTLRNESFIRRESWYIVIYNEILFSIQC